MKETLTTEQQFCIVFPSSSVAHKPHLVIEAGAGAGKTFVLTEHVYWRLVDAPPAYKLSSNQIFIVTFTRSAESEISERIRRRFQQTRDSETESIGQHVHVSTIDSLFHKLLESQFSAWWEKHVSTTHSQQSRNVFSVPRALLVNDTAAAQRLDREFLADILSLIESHPLKAELVDFILCGGLRASLDTTSIYAKPSGLRQEIIRFMLSEPCFNPAAPPLRFATRSLHPASTALISKMKVFAIHAFYRRIAAGEFTHTDRTVFLHLLFCKHPEELTGTIFYKTQPENFPILPAELIVDEYQDTNRLQHEILFEIVKRSKGKMIVVGDPKQSIYGFRQAHVGVFQSLFDDPQWTHVELLKNFRSDPHLLEEINLLSRYCFDFKVDSLPKTFLSSSFYQSAAAKQIGMKSLTPGLAPNFQNIKMPHVVVIGASLNQKRFAEGDDSRAMAIDDKVRLFDFQLWGLARHLKDTVESGQFSWQQIAILCERNSQIETIAALFKQLGLPIQTKISKRYANNPHLAYAHECAHVLFELLLGPVAIGALYKLLISPLVNCNPTLVDGLAQSQNDLTISLIRFPKQSKVKREFKSIETHEFFDRMNHIVSQCRALLTTSPFAAWQKLRHSLCEKPNTDFLTSMEEFATALAGLSESPQMQKILDDFQSSDVNRKVDSVIPILREYVFSNIPVPFEHSVSHTQDNALTLQTVHGAKGLEWPCVVFWPYSRTSPASSFSIAQGEQDTYLKWLSEDAVDFSVFRRTQNSALTEIDYELSQSTKNPNKKSWFIDLQNDCEELFERQRVFYTALTRAKKKLILMSPFYYSARTRSSLRDNIAKIPENRPPEEFAEHFSRLEDHMVASYLDQNFYLRKSPERGDAPNPPWFGREGEAIAKSAFCNASFFEYGPDWYDECVQQLHASQSVINPDLEVLAVSENSEAKQTETKLLNWQPLPLLPTSDRGTQINKSLFIKAGASSATAGVRFHAAQESLPQFSDQSLIGELFQRSRFHRQEWELWIPDKAAARAQLVSSRPPKRKVVDLILGMDRTAFLDVLRKLQLSEPFVYSDLHASILDTHKVFLVVVDFKTGRPSESHRLQVEEYSALVKKLASDSWLARQFADSSYTMDNVFVCGFIQYVSLKTGNTIITPNDSFTLVI